MNKKNKLTEEKLNASRSRQANYEFVEKVNNLRIYMRSYAIQTQMAAPFPKKTNLGKFNSK